MPKKKEAPQKLIPEAGKTYLFIAGSSDKYIFHVDQIKQTRGHVRQVGSYVYLGGKSFTTPADLDITAYTELREATGHEERHIQACIKAKKYVDIPKEEIINDFQIF